MIKVNVWQVGYLTDKDCIAHNIKNTEARESGYVLLDKDEDLWEETVWNLLNWSCWSRDENGDEKKPESVHSKIAYCNSDIILKRDDQSVYRCCEHSGWFTANSLEEAIKHMKEVHHGLWPLHN